MCSEAEPGLADRGHYDGRYGRQSGVYLDSNFVKRSGRRGDTLNYQRLIVL